MRTLRCPRCQSIVQAPEGQPPVCSHCGFGGLAGDAVPAAKDPRAPRDVPSAAPSDSPAAASATPTFGAPATGISADAPIQPDTDGLEDALRPVPVRPRRTGLVVAAFAVALLLVAGAVAAAVLLWPSDPGALSQEESQRRVEAAMESLPQALSDGGDIREVTGTMAVQDEAWIGPASISFAMEWGKNGVVKVAAQASQPGFTLDFTMYCTPDRIIIVFGEQAVEERQAEDDCEIMDEADFSDSPLAGLEEGDVSIEEVTPHKDGTVTAVLVNGTERMTMHLDAQGRVARIQMDSEEGSMDMRFSYGARRTIELPSDTMRAPADITGEGHWSDGTYRWEAWYGTPVPLSEFEVRVMDGTTRVATFALTSDSQSSNGVTFQFIDDGDGMFGSGDEFTVSAPTQYDVVVWDTWADRDITDDVGAPGLPVVALLGALVFLGAVLRRR